MRSNRRGVRLSSSSAAGAARSSGTEHVAARPAGARCRQCARRAARDQEAATSCSQPGGADRRLEQLHRLIGRVALADGLNRTDALPAPQRHPAAPHLAARPAWQRAILAARRMPVDWLAEAGQSLWQVLPLGGLGPGNCLASEQSAGSPASRRLAQRRSRRRRAGTTRAMDFLRRWCRTACSAWRSPSHVSPQRSRHGRARRAGGLRAAALPTGWAITRATSWRWSSTTAGAIWCKSGRRPESRARAGHAAACARTHRERIAFWVFCQCASSASGRPYMRTRTARRMQIVGDTPIFVAWQSADGGRGPSSSSSMRAGRPTVVAGVPPILQRHRPALGQPAVPLERAREGRLCMVGGARAAQLRAGGHRAHRPLPRASRRMGDSRQRAHRTEGHVG